MSWRCIGRPRIDRELRELIRRMSREDPTCGAPRIQDSDSSFVGRRRAELSTLTEGGIIAMPILGGRIINTFGFEVFTKDSKQTYLLIAQPPDHFECASAILPWQFIQNGQGHSLQSKAALGLGGPGQTVHGSVYDVVASLRKSRSVLIRTGRMSRLAPRGAKQPVDRTTEGRPYD
jgi:hypothetical protein